MELEPGLLVQTFPADRCLSPTASEAAIAGLLLTLDIDTAVQPYLQKLKEALRPYKTRNASECASRGAAAQHLSSDMKKTAAGLSSAAAPSTPPPTPAGAAGSMRPPSTVLLPPGLPPPSVPCPIGADAGWSERRSTIGGPSPNALLAPSGVDGGVQPLVTGTAVQRGPASRVAHTKQQQACGRLPFGSTSCFQV